MNAHRFANFFIGLIPVLMVLRAYVSPLSACYRGVCVTVELEFKSLPVRSKRDSLRLQHVVFGGWSRDSKPADSMTSPGQWYNSASLRFVISNTEQVHEQYKLSMQTIEAAESGTFVALERTIRMQEDTLVRVVAVHPRPPEPIRGNDAVARDTGIVFCGQRLQHDETWCEIWRKSLRPLSG